MKVTVLSLPQENGALVKIYVTLSRFPQANLFLAKIIVLDFTGVCCDSIVRPDRVTSEKAEISFRASPEIRVLGCISQPFRSRKHPYLYPTEQNLVYVQTIQLILSQSTETLFTYARHHTARVQLATWVADI